MYNTPEPGCDVANRMTDERIGPVQGVQPAAKAIPIKVEPMYPDGRFLNSNLRSFIKKSGFNMPTIIKPKKIIKIPPSWRIKSLYSLKKLPRKEVPNPIAIKIIENP